MNTKSQIEKKDEKKIKKALEAYKNKEQEEENTPVAKNEPCSEQILLISKSPFFQKQIKKAFDKYDIDGSGELDHIELREFVDDLRELLNLSPSDDAIFFQILYLLDVDGNGTVELEEFYDKLGEVLPILSKPGTHMEKILRNTFKDFDLDGSGSLERNELKLIFNLTCDRMGVERPTASQIDYIISLIDDDENAEIDEEEFVENYYIINRELSKNNSLTDAKKKRDLFNEEKLAVKGGSNEEDEDFLATFTQVCRSIQKEKKNEKEPLVNNGQQGDDEKLNKINSASNTNARTFVSMSTFINEKYKKNDGDGGIKEDDFEDSDSLEMNKDNSISVHLNANFSSRNIKNKSINSRIGSRMSIRNSRRQIVQGLNTDSDDEVVQEKPRELTKEEQERLEKIEMLKNNEKSADEILTDINWTDEFKT